MMFGVSRSESTNKRKYKFFDLKSMTDNELILRILPNPYSENKIYTKNYFHKINGKLYYHPSEDKCLFCNILSNDIKYEDIQNRLLRLKVQDKREKWLHIITNVTNVSFYAIISGHGNSIYKIVFWEDMANQFINIMMSKGITEDIVDLRNGNALKFKFTKLNYFPYLKLVDIIVNPNKQPLYKEEEKIQQLEETLQHIDDFDNKVTEEYAMSIIEKWYDEAVRYYDRNYRVNKPKKEEALMGMDVDFSTLRDEDNNEETDLGDNFMDDNNEEDGLESDELPF